MSYDIFSTKSEWKKRITLVHYQHEHWQLVYWGNLLKIIQVLQHNLYFPFINTFKYKYDTPPHYHWRATSTPNADIFVDLDHSEICHFSEILTHYFWIFSLLEFFRVKKFSLKIDSESVFIFMGIWILYRNNKLVQRNPGKLQK